MTQVQEQPHGIVINVKDRGVGIDEDTLERMFDPFFTQRPGGTGLGLSIAYQIVNKHGDHIEARLNADKGTTVTVTLPFKEEKTALPKN